MLLIPAIDIKGGECVRLRQGRMDDVTVFGADPAEMAQRWIDAGAERLHVVDLDGATKGEPVNLEAISRICEVAGEIPVQVGGGIREEDDVEALLDAGAGYVIVGTRALARKQIRQVLGYLRPFGLRIVRTACSIVALCGGLGIQGGGHWRHTDEQRKLCALEGLHGWQHVPKLQQKRPRGSR